MRINEVGLTEGSSEMKNYFGPEVSFSLGHLRNTARLLGLTYVPKDKKGIGKMESSPYISMERLLVVWTNLTPFYPVK